MRSSLLEVDRLSVALPVGAERARAVDGVSFDVVAGEIVCLVGESGSGKTVIAQSVMGLLPPELRPSSGRVLL
jgi:peptide/nickel transport system ATP-binding protein